MTNNYKRHFIMVVIALFGIACKCVFNVTLSHLLGHAMYANFSLGFQTLSFCSLVILLGTSSADEIFLANYLQNNEYSSAQKYAIWSIRTILRNSKWYLIFLAVIATIMILSGQSHAKDLKSYHITFYLIFLAPLVALKSLSVSALQCNKNLIMYNLLIRSAWFIIFISILSIVSYSYNQDINQYLLIVITTISMIIIQFQKITIRKIVFWRWHC